MTERSSSFSVPRSVLIGSLALAGLSLTGLYNYLLFHSLAESFSIVIGGTIFILAWNSRTRLDTDYLLFLGIAYIFVSGLDLLHSLAYQGMGVFPASDANLATQLWIAARGIQSLSLLGAIVFLHRRLNVSLALGGYTILTALLLGAIFSGRFPVCFIAGVGLTAFKKISEYLICLTLAAATVALLRNREAFDPDVLRWLIGSLLLTIGSEFAFTSYINVYGVANFSGHVLKILAFILLYKAILEMGIERPHRLVFRNLQQGEASLREALEQVRSLAEIDPLTGLFNRRHFSELMRREFERARRYGHPFSVIMLDVDHFKGMNDAYGHAVGDRILAELATCFRRVLRTSDLVGRYGGDEFAIMLPETDLPAAQQTGERLREECSQRTLDAGGRPITITVSMGIAALDEECASQDTLLDRADGALYAAKRAGRNRVSVWSRPNVISATEGG